MATLEGIVLDPGLYRQGNGRLDRPRPVPPFRRRRNIVFMHTGGIPAMFAYADHF